MPGFRPGRTKFEFSWKSVQKMLKQTLIKVIIKCDTIFDVRENVMSHRIKRLKMTTHLHLLKKTRNRSIIYKKKKLKRNYINISCYIQFLWFYIYISLKNTRIVYKRTVKENNFHKQLRVFLRYFMLIIPRNNYQSRCFVIIKYINSFCTYNDIIYISLFLWSE